MIDSFFLSWELFRNTYLAGWLIALVLSLTGVWVVAKDQIFIGAAVSQASALGIALAAYVGALAGRAAHEESAPLPAVMAVVFSVLASLATARGGGRRESHEAVTGWIFLLSSSASVLLLSRSPQGLEEIRRLSSSSLIGATDGDVWLFTGLGFAAVALLAGYNRHILLLATDPVMAEAGGMRTWRWSMAVSVWLGVCAGLSLRVSGMLYTFGLLVLPALVAKNVCREIRPMFLAAPLIGVGAAVGGFVLANHFDFPPGQMTVAILSLLLPLGWIVRRVWINERAGK